MTISNKITSGFAFSAQSPVANGIEDYVFILNRDEWVLTFDTTNPLLITGITAAAGATSPKIYKFEGTNNSFDNNYKLVKTDVGPRYTHELDFNLAGHTTLIKQQEAELAYGKYYVICINNYKDGDSAIELLGAQSGLQLSEGGRQANDESVEGGHKLKMANPNKIREPYPPASVSIAPQSGTATYASTLAALEALAA